MNSKRKGTAGENEIVILLRAFGIYAVRNDQIFISGKENPDVSAEFAGVPLHIEVKRVERLNVNEAMKQAVTDANGKAFPVLAHRRNRGKWLVTFPLVDLLRLLTGGETI